MKTVVSSLKNDLAEISLEIISLKKYIRDSSNPSGTRSERQSELHSMRRKARWMHIAHDLSKGRTYEQIEKPAMDNPPDWEAIKALQEAYAQKETQDAAA